MPVSAGRNSASSCSPASVGATLRVVRASSRTPTCSSSPRIAWLSADCVTSSRFAALVKLLSSATAVSHVAIVDAPIPGTTVFERVRSNPRVWHFAFHNARYVAEALVAGRERPTCRHSLMPHL